MEHRREPADPQLDGGRRRAANDSGQGHAGIPVTKESFTDFDLSFEWFGEAGCNSGVKYRFQGYWAGQPGSAQLKQAHEGPGRIEPVALEYQIADDEAHPDAVGDLKHSTASLYEYWPPQKSGPAKAGMWHSGRIVARGLHIEHWLDGKKVVDLSLDSPDLQESFRKSPRRGSSPVLAKHERRSSPIALQFHDGLVRFRNLTIRPLPAP